ncbi:hypothetical protein HCY65_10970 [Acinetobacter radioresistens]|uniref:hypothetical protein n=1 Tax=Acinetobacter radioresistens TaxID=40216 RepID=UPI002002B493|nr:hypothetical protein [Acinetobacter radioresistens]MCK4111577.1 hypothetical protein [Acinetobacter radioresistens]
MYRFILLAFMIITSGLAQAESYAQAKKQVRNKLVACFKEPENMKFSAAFNGCLLTASDNFMQKANAEFKQQYVKASDKERSNLLKDRKIYLDSIKHCEVFQDLSYDGFTKEAMCKLQTAKDYLSLLTNGPASYPENWTIENRVDKLFIGY